MTRSSARLHQSHDTPGSNGVDAPDSMALAPKSSGAMWLTSYGDWGETDATANVAIVQPDLCRDHRRHRHWRLPASDWRLGIAGGYAHTSFAINDYGSSGSSNGADFGAYAGGPLATLGRGTLQINLGATLRHPRRPGRARTSFMPGYSGKASSDFQATTAQAFGELAYDIDIGRTAIGAARVEPFAGLGTVSARTGSFSETGGAAALDGTARELWRDDIADRHPWRDAACRLPGRSIDLGGTIGWQHVFSDPTPSAEARLRCRRISVRPCSVRRSPRTRCSSASGSMRHCRREPLWASRIPAGSAMTPEPRGQRDAVGPVLSGRGRPWLNCRLAHRHDRPDRDQRRGRPRWRAPQRDRRGPPHHLQTASAP